MRRKWLWFLPIGVAAIALFIFIGGTVVQLLWNWLLPSLFGWPSVSFWQAVGILALSRILFGRWGGGGRGGHRWSSEEKDRFRQRIRERWAQKYGASAPAQNTPE